MSELKIKQDNYINILGWMATDLNLKGNELIIYACIHGFSQVDGQTYHSSLQYLAEWTNTSKRAVINTLKSLTEKGLILKTEKFVNGVKFCEYKTLKFTSGEKSSPGGGEKSSPGGGEKSSPGGGEKSSPNNKDINNKDIYIKDNIYSQVVDYLNERLGTKYRSSTPKTKSCIRARVEEGFTLDDFKTVIDKKCNEWLGTEWEKYLRPETLFGTKFESYLNANNKINKSNNTGQAKSSTAQMLDGFYQMADAWANS